MATIAAMLTGTMLLNAGVGASCLILESIFSVSFSNISAAFGLTITSMLLGITTAFAFMSSGSAITATAISGCFATAFALIGGAATIMGGTVCLTFGAIEKALGPTVSQISQLSGGFGDALGIIGTLLGIASSVVGMITALGGAGSICGTGMLYAGVGLLAAGAGLLFIATAAVIAAKALYLVVKLSGHSTNGVTSADFGININVNPPDIKRAASGGFPSMGQMFIAREAGPELVGTIGSRSAVVNNDQIVESVSAGVYRAVKAAMGQNGGGVIQLILDGTKVAEVVSDNVNAITRRTGRCPILV